MFVCQHLLKTYLMWDYMLSAVEDMKDADPIFIPTAMKVNKGI